MRDEIGICLNEKCGVHTSQAQKDAAKNFYSGLLIKDKDVIDHLTKLGGSDMWISSLIDKAQRVSGNILGGMKADLFWQNSLEDEIRVISLDKANQTRQTDPSLTDDEIKNILNISDYLRKSKHIIKVPPNIKKEIENCVTCKSKIPMGKGKIGHLLDMHPEIFLYFGNGTDKGNSTGDVRGVVAFLDSIDFDKTKLGKKEKRRKIKEEKQRRLLNKLPRLPKYNKNSLSRPKRTQVEIINKIESLDAVNQEPKLKTVEITTYERPGSIIRQLKTLHKKCMICQVEHFTKADGDQYSEVCHIIPHHTSQNNNSNNLIVLCPTCHKKFDLGILADRKIMYEQLKMNYPAESFIIPIWYDEVKA